MLDPNAYASTPFPPGKPLPAHVDAYLRSLDLPQPLSPHALALERTRSRHRLLRALVPDLTSTALWALVLYGVFIR